MRTAQITSLADGSFRTSGRITITVDGTIHTDDGLDVKVVKLEAPAVGRNRKQRRASAARRGRS